MATFKQLSERKYKLIAFNGYRPDGRKRSKARTVTVPESIPKRGILQYVRAQADELEREFKFGFSEDADSSFEEFASKWLMRQTHYKPSTLETYRGMLDYCSQIIGGVRLRDIRPMTIEYLTGMLRQKQTRGRPISEKTVKKYVKAVGVVLEDAVRNGIIQVNPVRRVRFPHAELAVQEIPSVDDMQRLIDCIMREPFVYRLFYTLSIMTGCRRGELCALRWEDVQGRALRISKSRSSIRGKGVVETDTKNHRVRFVPLCDLALTMLRDFYNYRSVTGYDDADFNYIPAHAPTPDEHIFTAEGAVIHPDTFTSRLRRLYDRNGFPRCFHLHTLRHFTASYLMGNGVSNQVTADILGHRDTGFLERTYGHRLPEFSEAAANCIQGLFNSLPNAEPLKISG